MNDDPGCERCMDAPAMSRQSCFVQTELQGMGILSSLTLRLYRYSHNTVPQDSH